MSLKISVIIPVFNGENTIHRCLDSVRNQTYFNLEIIVVDDGSTDKTQHIVKSIKDERIKYIYQKNSGQGFARNTGIENSTGSYLGFVDADDTIEPQMYEKMINAAKLNDAQVVQCAINDIRENSSLVRPVINDSFVEIKNREEYASDFFRGHKHSNEVCNKLIEKKFLKDNKLNFADTKRIFSEDFLLNINMLSCLERVQFIHDALYNYYINESGHCLSDKFGRIAKIRELFCDALKTCDKSVEKTIEFIAADVILIYCKDVLNDNEEYVYKIIKAGDMKRYMKTYMTYKCSIKHSIYIFVLLFVPNLIKKILITNIT